MRRLIAAALIATQAACATTPIAGLGSATEQERRGADCYATGRMRLAVGWSAMIAGGLGLVGAGLAESTTTVDERGRVGTSDDARVKAGVAAGVVAAIGAIVAALGQNQLDEGTEHFATALRLRTEREKHFMQAAKLDPDDPALPLPESTVVPPVVTSTAPQPVKRHQRAPFYTP